MCLLSSILVFTLCTLSIAEFINPPPAGDSGDYEFNSIYTAGQSITISWASPYEDVDILMWHDNPGHDEPACGKTKRGSSKPLDSRPDSLVL